jgi:hypothetical protein
LIDYSEFLAATMDRKIYLQYNYLWQVFKQFDSSKTGKLNKDDLAMVLSGGKDKKYVKGKTSIMTDIDEIMTTYDSDKSGDIDFDEFMELMRGSAQTAQEGNSLATLKEKTDKNDEELLAVTNVEIAPPGKTDDQVLDDAPRNVGCCGFF